MPEEGLWAPGEAGRHSRGMMDGSHASHCEKIIARCRQPRQCGSWPMPWENKDSESQCVSERRPACGAPNLHIYMRRSRVNCSEFLRWVQSGGCCCFILHNKHTVSTHSPPFPRILNERCRSFMQIIETFNQFGFSSHVVQDCTCNLKCLNFI